MTDLETQLTALKQEAQQIISGAADLDQLEQHRIQFLGKKGQLSQILKGMGKLDASDRPRIGAIANEVKEAVQGCLGEKRSDLQNAQIQARLASETLDVTMPGTYTPQGNIHPLNGMIDRARAGCHRWHHHSDCPHHRPQREHQHRPRRRLYQCLVPRQLYHRQHRRK